MVLVGEIRKEGCDICPLEGTNDCRSNTFNPSIEGPNPCPLENADDEDDVEEYMGIADVKESERIEKQNADMEAAEKREERNRRNRHLRMEERMLVSFETRQIKRLWKAIGKNERILSFASGMADAFAIMDGKELPKKPRTPLHDENDRMKAEIDELEKEKAAKLAELKEERKKRRARS